MPQQFWLGQSPHGSSLKWVGCHMSYFWIKIKWKSHACIRPIKKHSKFRSQFLPLTFNCSLYPSIPLSKNPIQIAPSLVTTTIFTLPLVFLPFPATSSSSSLLWTLLLLILSHSFIHSSSSYSFLIWTLLLLFMFEIFKENSPS